MSSEVDDFLAHYGVKGMHWGVRKASSTSVSTAKPQKSAAQLAKDKQVRAARIQKAKVWTGRAVLALIALDALRDVGVLAGIGMDTAIMNKQASNAAKSAANAFSDSHGLWSMRIIDI